LQLFKGQPNYGIRIPVIKSSLPAWSCTIRSSRMRGTWISPLNLTMLAAVSNLLESDQSFLWDIHLDWGQQQEYALARWSREASLKNVWPLIYFFLI
jgi:hypothetical protein